MKPQHIFQKALLLLDREELTQGEQQLRLAIVTADQEGDLLTLVRAQCALGELLYQLERRDEAKQWLRKVAEVNRDDDLLDYEVNIAQEILDEMNNEFL